MTTSDYLYWIPRIFFAIVFLWLGVIAFRNRSIPINKSWWLFLVYIGEWIIEISFRAYFSYTAALAADKVNGYSLEVFRIYLLPNLQKLLERQAMMILIAGVVWFLLAVYARRTHEEKLDLADVNVFTFGVLVSGWPNFFIYLGLVFIFSALFLATALAIKKMQRMTVTPFFALAGIVILFWGWQISHFVGLYALR